MNIDKKAIGQRIKSLRQSKGMTLEEFGKLFNASKSIVLRWENGTAKPNAERTKAIAKIADITVDELLYGSELSSHQVKDMLLNNSLKPILDKKIEFFLEHPSYVHLITGNKFMYLATLRLYLRLGENPDIDSTKELEKMVLSKVTNAIIDDLYKEIPYLEKGDNPYAFELVTGLLNDDVNPVYFFDYLISIYEYIAKYIPICLVYMLEFRLKNLIDGFNYLLSDFDPEDETVEFEESFLTPDRILNEINFSDYTKLMNKLHDALSFVKNSLFPTENNTED